MIRTQTRFYRAIALVLTFSMVNLCLPLGLANVFKFADKSPARPEAPKPKAPVSRFLHSKEMKQIQGRTGENPYLAGQNKWDVVYHGIDTITGNYSTSATDLSFDGGYGIPVNVTRSYSANDANEGPFGKGWSLSADLRSTAGGVLKSPSAPLRIVQLGFKERSSQQLDDPNFTGPTGSTTQPAAAVQAVDASGKEETIQKDVDGILSTPPWDNNTIDSVYTTVTMGSQTYQVLVSNKVTTIDGTVYTYQAEGSYPAGTYPWYNSAAAPEPANVLKVTAATDRQGNITAYNYGAGTVTFNKCDGTTVEHPLTSVVMPNGHTITFTWGNGTNAPVNRIFTASDGVRTVTYGYTNGLLTSVTTPAGRTTNYGYGSSNTVLNPVNTATATNLLTSITDPRGLTTTISYYVENTNILPYSGVMQGVRAYRLGYANGTSTYVLPGTAYDGSDPTPAGLPSLWAWAWMGQGIVYITDLDTNGSMDGSSSVAANAFIVTFSVASGVVTVTTCPFSNFHGYYFYANNQRPYAVRSYDSKSQNLLEEDRQNTNAEVVDGLLRIPLKVITLPAQSDHAAAPK